MGVDGSAQMLLVDDFAGPQEGLWAPIAWFPLDADLHYTREGQLAANGFTFLTFDFGRKPDVVNRAGGLTIAIDVTGLRGTDSGGWVVVKIGRETGEVKAGEVGVLVWSDYTAGKQDQVFHRDQLWDAGDHFDMGDTIRFEIFTGDVGVTGKNARANVFIDDKLVLSNFEFQWDRGPTYLCLGASGPAKFDNLKIALAEPVIEFAEPILAAAESQGRAFVPVVLKRPIVGRKYSVDYSVVGGTAGHGDDFDLGEGTLDFAPGVTEQNIAVYLKNDGTDEFDETVVVALENPTGPGVRLGRTSEHTFTIIGQEPLVSFERSELSVSEDAGTVEIGVVLSHDCSKAVTVGYAVTGGTATNGADYKVQTGTLKLAPGQKRGAVSVGIVDDQDSENSIDETFTVALGNPKNARIGDAASCRYSIVDNEPGIEWDGCVWFASHDKHVKRSSLFYVNESDQLVWIPHYGGHMMVKAREQDLSDVGDVAEYTWLYRADGLDAGSGFIDLTERWGSGDFRWGLFDTNGRPISPQQMYRRVDKRFCGWLGYQTRLSPHESPKFRADRYAKRIRPNGDGCSEVFGWGDDQWGPTKNFTGHGAPLGEFSPMSFVIERKSPSILEFSLTLNDITHTYVDDDPTNQPKKIDAMAIYFANPRLFERVILAKPK
jgi:hypothetical protein